MFISNVQSTKHTSIVHTALLALPDNGAVGVLRCYGGEADLMH